MASAPSMRAAPATCQGMVAFIWALLALGIAARCRQYVGCPSYSYDEAYLLLNVFERSYTELVGALSHNLVVPPLFNGGRRSAKPGTDLGDP
jgi:hypothetical protein